MRECGSISEQGKVLVNLSALKKYSTIRWFGHWCLAYCEMLLRDIDLMLEVAERAEISACLSVPTLEEKAWRASEPHTPHPRARLEPVAKLK